MSAVIDICVILSAVLSTCIEPAPRLMRHGVFIVPEKCQYRGHPFLKHVGVFGGCGGGGGGGRGYHTYAHKAHAQRCDQPIVFIYFSCC